MKFKQTSQKYIDQDKPLRVLFCVILLILSGVILYTDKIFNFHNIGQDIDFRYYNDLESFIWHVSQTISPLLMILSIAIYVDNKYIRLSLLCPLSIYSIQVMYIMRDEHYIERDYFYIYTLFFIVAFILNYILIQKIIKMYSGKINKLNQKIKTLFTFIYSLNTTNVIKEEKEREFAISRIEVTDEVILEKQ